MINETNMAYILDELNANPDANARAYYAALVGLTDKEFDLEMQKGIINKLNPAKYTSYANKWNVLGARVRELLQRVSAQPGLSGIFDALGKGLTNVIGSLFSPESIRNTLLPTASSLYQARQSQQIARQQARVELEKARIMGAAAQPPATTLLPPPPPPPGIAPETPAEPPGVVAKPKEEEGISKYLIPVAIGIGVLGLGFLLYTKSKKF